MFVSVNPATGAALREYPPHTLPELDAAVRVAARRQTLWRAASVADRVRPLRRAGVALRQRRDPLARLMAEEMGKPVKDGRAEIEKCAWLCEFYADHAERFLHPETVTTDAQRSYIAFAPLGVVLAVMPWNFPFWQVFRAAIPTLAAGNAVVLKHAANVPGCAEAIEGLFREADLPPGLFASLRVGTDRVETLIRHPAVAAVTLTGSTAAGKAVARVAADTLKKCVLELGGSDPYIVLADADIAATARRCAKARLVAAGQSCIAAKRMIVVDAVRQEFEQALVEAMRSYTVGDPLDEATDIGPLARVDLRDALAGQVRASVALGANTLLGGEVPDRRGAWYPPTVLTGVASPMPAADEETFGPVAAVQSAADRVEAIRLANRSRYGLGAAVFTADVEAGERIAREELAAGSCFVNEAVRSDPRLPFGGVKASGLGRELGAFGIREFVNVKTVYVGSSPERRRSRPADDVSRQIARAEAEGMVTEAAKVSGETP